MRKPNPLIDVDRLLAEPGPKDSVVLFKVQFEGSPKTYSYVAVKAPDLWFVTSGPAQGLPWENLLDWLDHRGGEVVSMQLATGGWEDL